MRKLVMAFALAFMGLTTVLTAAPSSAAPSATTVASTPITMGVTSTPISALSAMPAGGYGDFYWAKSCTITSAVSPSTQKPKFVLSNYDTPYGMQYHFQMINGWYGGTWLYRQSLTWNGIQLGSIANGYLNRADKGERRHWVATWSRFGRTHSCSLDG